DYYCHFYDSTGVLF
nr:immunoglobulin light chain junction region [Macaca mulatta]